MKPIEIFTVVGITATLILGIYNLLINIRSQRKFQRELIFSKQFDFYMKTQDLLTDFMDAVDDMNENDISLKATQDKIYNLSDDIDKHITKNEIIIPDGLYTELSDISLYCHKISILAYKEPLKIDEKLKKELLDQNIDLVDLIRQQVGIEHLSEENRKLAKGIIENK